MEMKDSHLVCITGGGALWKGIEALPFVCFAGWEWANENGIETLTPRLHYGGELTRMELKHSSLVCITGGISRKELKHSPSFALRGGLTRM
jgi:hypothetical protein